MFKILHFADAHIDIAAHGRRDPETGLPLRVLDFLKALDQIVDTAIAQKVDLVLFAGDAYKDRTPVPTFQREFGKRIIRLSEAGIPTVLLVGNHDLSPATGRAHALQEFDTLQVPHVHVISQPCFWKPEDLEGLPIQIIGLPWVSRSSLMAALQLEGDQISQIYSELETRLSELVQEWLQEVDPTLPVILTAHMSIQGAKYGGERSVMLGNDLVLSGGLVRDPRLDYVALGHIHKAQNLNDGNHPPVIYPGSIERVDFGEAEDEKYFVIAEVEKGHTAVVWHKLAGRPFIDRSVMVDSPDNTLEQMISGLPSRENLRDAIVRLIVLYPRIWEASLDEKGIRQYAEEAFEFHLVRRPQMDARIRLPKDQAISTMNHLELLELYWRTVNLEKEEKEDLQKSAREIMAEIRGT